MEILDLCHYWQGSGLLPYGTRSSLEPMSTNHQWGLVAITIAEYHRKCSRYLFLICIWKLQSQGCSQYPQGPMGSNLAKALSLSELSFYLMTWSSLKCDNATCYQEKGIFIYYCKLFTNALLQSLYSCRISQHIPHTSIVTKTVWNDMRHPLRVQDLAHVLPVLKTCCMQCDILLDYIRAGWFNTKLHNFTGIYGCTLQWREGHAITSPCPKLGDGFDNIHRQKRTLVKIITSRLRLFCFWVLSRGNDIYQKFASHTS